MNTDKIVIPDTIRAGFQNRDDTYSGKLAYVIYQDDKGKWRKEASWQSWKDDKIKPQTMKNEPTSGFVLNRDVGGVRQSYGWDARIEKVRVYDPRGFEIEITIPNMLFILQECTSTKGKGLEGDFVYGWQGTSLILMPTTCKEYIESQTYTTLVSELKPLKIKELVPGCLYTNKGQEKLMYLGKMTFRNYTGKLPKIQHVFFDVAFLDANAKSEDDDSDYLLWRRYKACAGLVGKRLTETPAPEFPEVYEKLMKKTIFAANPVSLSLVPLSKEEKQKIKSSYSTRHNCLQPSFTEKNGVIYRYSCQTDDRCIFGPHIPYNDRKVDVYLQSIASIKPNEANLPEFVLEENKEIVTDQSSWTSRYSSNYSKYKFEYTGLTNDQLLDLKRNLVITYDNGLTRTRSY